MSTTLIKSMQSYTDRGKLQIQLVSQIQNRPVQGAKISISYTGAPGQPLEQLQTNSSGQTETIELAAPPVEYSLQPSEEQPYSEYNLNVEAEGYEPIEISGSEILSGEISRQKIELRPISDGNYEDVVIPEYVVVHDGSPADSTADNYYVRYRDYIKNVACSEIYATWPPETIKANVLAIMSFTLNRVYTEWYRNKKYDFTITSSTAFDHKWMHGRNIFDSISNIVDELFENYLSRPNVRQPILTQYCDGRRVTCPQWMSQWGSKYLGDQNYTAIEIIRNYYGESMYINSAEEISGIPASWPGYDLDIGASGMKVRQIQEQLNTIGEVYREVPRGPVGGIYGERTKEAVRQFQSVFGLGQTGVVDYLTWYKIQEIYVGITRIAELY